MRRAPLRTFLPVLGAFAAPGLAQSIVPYLPEGTVLAIEVPDLNASIGEFTAMPLAKMWREKEVQDFVQDAKEVVAQQIKKGIEQAKQMHEAGMLPVDPDALTNLRVKGMSFAITQLNVAGDPMPMPEIGLMLQVDFGDTAKEWFGLLEMGMGILGQTGKMERESVKVDDAEFASFKPKKAPPGLKMSLNVAMVGNSVLIGTLREQVGATIEQMHKGTPLLAATARYKNSLKHLSVDGAEASAFLRTDALLDFAVQVATLAAAHEPNLEWLDGDGLARAFDALGVRGIESFASASSYRDGKAVTSFYTVSPAPARRGFLANNKNLDTSFLKWVPKDAAGFSASTFDPMSVYTALVAAVNAYDPKIGEMVLGHLAEIEKASGFSLRDDLFGAMGDTMIKWSMPMASIAAPPETAVLIKVNDADKIVKALKAMAGMSNGAVELDEAEKRGVKTYQFRINMDPMRGMGMNPLDVLNPSFAFKDGWLVAGFAPADIRQTFKRMDRSDDDPKSDIRSNKEFAAYLSQLPKEVQALSFDDWKAEFESYYQIVSSLLAFVPPNENIPFDMSMLPDAATLTKHLFGSLSYTVADGEGIEGTTISPFGPEVVVFFAAIVAAGVGFAVTMRARF